MQAQKANRHQVLGWAMYDWANSAFSTTVVAVFLGPYLASLAREAAKSAPDGVARFFGLPMAPDSFLPFMVSFSVVFQAGLLPILGAIADYSNRRKQMLFLFAALGACATMGLFFVQGALWPIGGLLFIAANLAFGASIVFYNAYLPTIAPEHDRDRVSSFGWAMGYLGGAILLIVNLAIFLLRNSLGIDGGLAVRINLGSAGLWWLLWTLVSLRALPDGGAPRALPAGDNIFSIAFKQLSHTMEAPAKLIAALLLSPLSVILLFPIIAALGLPKEWLVLAMLGPIIMLAIFLRRKSRTLPETAKFLLSYLIYNDGIQTVIGSAAVFAAAPVINGGIEMPTDRLTLLVLMIQMMAFAGALAFGALAKRLGTKRALVLSLFIWTATVVYGYFGVQGSEIVSTLGIPRREFEFWVLGAVIAVVLGGSQALSRSLFSRMIPKSQEAEFFSIYEISERGTSWMGPYVFATVNDRLGNLRPAILSIIIFFALGLAILFFVNVKRAFAEAAQSPSDEGVES
jgi:MFS transporter, UMF1 family